MKRVAFVLLTVIGASAILAAGLQRVSVEGKFATSDVIVRNGKTYAPIGDIARALGMTVVKTSSGYDLIRPGGANMVQGLRGKVGEELFNGRHKFTVVKVIRTDSYMPQFSGSTNPLTPSGANNEILVLVCRLKNGTKDPVTYDLLMGKNTGVTDMDEQSYECYKGAAIDVRERGPRVLPGAAVNFALTFQIPKSAVLKDLVYTIVDFTKESPDFRVSLKQD